MEISDQIKIVLDSFQMEQSIKWGRTVYHLNRQNVCAINQTKHYVSVWFFQGALLADDAHRLTNAQQSKTQAMRQLRFESWTPTDIDLLKHYVKSAISIALSGKKFTFIRPLIKINDLLINELNKNKELNEAFYTLSKGKQNEYHDYIESAKQNITKLKRLSKIIPMILMRKGLNDIYRNR